MAAAKIMVIRHAEKPGAYHGKSYAGVTAEGAPDPESLVTLGWQRAGGLVTLLAPARGPSQSLALAPPTALFASDPEPGAKKDPDSEHGPSQRPYQTIAALAARLGKPIDNSYRKKHFDKMVAAALAATGVVLISWQHQDIPAIGAEILKRTGSSGIAVPAKWPGERYDLVWVFDRPAGTGPVKSFTQVPQLLLAGDQSSVIPTTG